MSLRGQTFFPLQRQAILLAVLGASCAGPPAVAATGERPGASKQRVAFRDRSPVAGRGPVRLLAAPARPTVIYLATEGIAITQGVSDATQDQSSICGAQVPPFDHSIFGASRPAVVDALAGHVHALFADFNVQVVTTRPKKGPYDLVAVGGSAALCKLGVGFSGYSPLDCGDQWPQDVSFVFSDGITSLPFLAVIIAHEIGHAHGLPHTAEACDVMSNLLCAPQDKRFFDKEMPITPDHLGRCGGLASTANSYQLALAALGARPAADGGGDVSVSDAGSDVSVRDAGGPHDRGIGEVGFETGASEGEGGCGVSAGGRRIASRSSSVSAGRGPSTQMWPAGLFLLGLASGRRRRKRQPNFTGREGGRR